MVSEIWGLRVRHGKEIFRFSTLKILLLDEVHRWSLERSEYSGRLLKVTEVQLGIFTDRRCSSLFVFLETQHPQSASRGAWVIAWCCMVFVVVLS